jgi:hypothetical protein
MVLHVERATYGAGSAQADVTGAVRAHVAQQLAAHERLVHLLASNGACGCDPAPGALKTLHVEGVLHGVRARWSAPENGSAVVDVAPRPPPAPPPPLSPLPPPYGHWPGHGEHGHGPGQWP